ncbi:hypothetical protein OAN27_00160 [Pelagibacteraceae bacterium]|jgi:F0F1-type ATP synthase assembly protein I|nr:hypothetical protein [Pelagibacteraceae bacterium]MDC0472366.1 hypothetical protein [Pelagibacteraceae bacterium]
MHGQINKMKYAKYQKSKTEQQKDRAAIFDLVQGFITIIVVGATLGALYESPWPLYFKIIIFGFMFVLGLILNELSRNGNMAKHSMDMLLLIFTQLNLMGKKQGVKQDEASKTIDDLEEATSGKMTSDRKLFGDFELGFVAVVLALVGLSAYITTILIK